jgi:hypothetical protein
MDFFLEMEHVKNIFEMWIYISTIDDNTHMDEWMYLIIVENIYHDEVKDFPTLSKYFHVLYLKSMYHEH